MNGHETSIPAGGPRAGRRARLRRWPWGLIGMLALVAGAEAILRDHEAASFRTNSAASWRQTARAARRDARRAEVLCFGDSMVKFGVAPRVLEAATGRTAYNLAPYGGPPAAGEILLRRALDSGARPRAIVVDFMPHLLAVAPRHHMRLWQEMIEPGDALRLAWESGDAPFFAEAMAGRALASIRARYEIRANLYHALRGESYNAVVAHYVTPLGRNWRVNRGGELAAKVPTFDGRARPDDNALFPRDWRPDPANTAAMRRFLDRAAARGIPVFWLLPPLSPATQALREQQGHDAFYTRLVRSVQSRYPNVTVVDARHAGFPHTLFTDPVHLDRDGAVTLTLRLAAVLRDRLDGPEAGHSGSRPAPRWVALPVASPGSPPIAPALEDLDQSRLVLQAIESRARR